MQTLIALLLCALILSFITIATLLAQLQKSDESYVRRFSEEQLRRGGLYEQQGSVEGTVSTVPMPVPSTMAPSVVVKPTVEQIMRHASVIRKDNQRVAMMVIYVGNSLPSWFRTFALSVEGSGDLVKWLIFVTEALELGDNYENIEIIRISRHELYQRMTRLDPHSGTIMLMDNLITQAPYSLVEFKPCLATIFEEYIANFTHWGYADVDVLMGRTKPFLSDSVLSSYDVYTVSFGDNRRYYMRGQLTIMKNNDVANNLWRQCKDLSQIGKRLKTFFDHPDESRRMNGWRFSSAEGCISKIVAREPGLRSLATSTLLSDAFKAPTAEKETLLINSMSLRCYGMPLSQLPSSDLASLFSDTRVYETPQSGGGASVGTDSTTNCAFWIPKQYQVCLDPAIDVVHDTIVENGAIVSVLDHYSLPVEGSTTGTCREATMTHFQGWKKEYTSFTTSQPPSDAHATVVTRTGFITLKVDIAKTLPNLPLTGAKLKTYGEMLGNRIWSGRILPSDVRETESQLLGPAGGYVPRLMGRKLIDIITALDIQHLNEKKRLISEHKELEMQTDYCVLFKETLSACTCPLQGSHITVLRTDPTVVQQSSITLVTVGWADEISSGAADELLTSFGNAPMHKIIVVAYENSPPPTKGHFSSLPRCTVIAVDLSACIEPNKVNDRVLPDKTLYNIGMDASSTDVVLMAPLYGRFRAIDNITDSRNMLKIASSEVLANAGYAVVFPIDKDGAECDIASMENLRPKPKHGGKNQAEVFDFRNQMVPIIFNMGHSAHGYRSPRLPEELNGDGCYSSVLFRVLAGHGYHMAHSRLASIRYAVPDLSPASTSPSRSCGCGALSSPAADSHLASFQHKSFTHFQRMGELRKKGISDVYARDPLGHHY